MQTSWVPDVVFAHVVLARTDGCLGGGAPGAPPTRGNRDHGNGAQRGAAREPSCCRDGGDTIISVLAQHDSLQANQLIAVVKP